MKIALFGGSGFIGRGLIDHFSESGDDLIVFSRKAIAQNKNQPENITWTTVENIGATILENTEIIINLSGASIAEKRWTDKRKSELRDSRIETTRMIVSLIESMSGKPKLLINASAVGFYDSLEDQAADEACPAGTGFLAKLCKKWENEAMSAERLGVRVVPLRLGVVLGNGGALKKMLPAFKYFAGAVIGSGRQGFPWIHISDVAGVIRHIIGHEAIRGPVNAVAPEAVNMREFAVLLGAVIRKPVWLRIPPWAMKLRFGEMSAALLTGQKVIPKKLLESGYVFAFPELTVALKDILTRDR